MKRLLFLVLLFPALNSLAQKSLISYEDIKYLLHNNLAHADTFLTAKGYVIAKKDNNTKNRKYVATLIGGTHNEISLRLDGRRLFIEIESNELNQYNLIRESVSQFLVRDGMVADIQTYSVKDLGNIYISVSEAVPYDPLRKDYTIQIMGDKGITVYN